MNLSWKILWILLGIGILFPFSCTRKDHSGNGSVTENQIAGVLVLENGTVAKSALVRLFEIQGNPDTILLVDSVRTDPSGSFVFQVMEGRTYSLYAELNGLQWTSRKWQASASSPLPELQAILQEPAWLHIDSLDFIDIDNLQWNLRIGLHLSIPLYMGIDTMIQVPAESLFFVSLRVANPSKSIERIWWQDSLQIPSGDSVRPQKISGWNPFEGRDSVILVDDFEDGSFWSTFESVWWRFEDGKTGGMSRSWPVDADSNNVDAPGAGGSQYAGHMAFVLDSIQPSYVGFGTSPGHQISARVSDFSDLQKLRFDIKGSGNVRVEICTHSSLSFQDENQCQWVADSIPTVWTHNEVAWNADSIPVLDRTLVDDVIFLLTPQSSGQVMGEFWVDNVEWIGSSL